MYRTPGYRVTSLRQPRHLFPQVRWVPCRPALHLGTDVSIFFPGVFRRGYRTAILLLGTVLSYREIIIVKNPTHPWTTAHPPWGSKACLADQRQGTSMLDVDHREQEAVNLGNPQDAKFSKLSAVKYGW